MDVPKMSQSKDQTTVVPAAILDTIKKLPAMPKVLHELTGALRSPEIDTKKIAKLVETDSTLTAKILQMANSPFFGFSRKIQSIPQAILLLGPKQIGYLAVSLSMNSKLASIAPGLNFQDFNAHSVACSMVSRQLASALRLPEPDELFLAGLLHDVGKLVLACAYPKESKELAMESTPENSDKTPLARELEAFGLEHAKVSAMVCEKWLFPTEVVHAIANHHCASPPEQVGRNEIVTIADFFSHEIGFGGLSKCCSSNSWVVDAAAPMRALLNLEEMRVRVEESMRGGGI